jgi:ATP-binding cassette subfamily F protein 3
LLSITEINYRIAGRPLLEQASLSVPKGHKVGLVGRNGTGKTTLLKLIAGETQPDAGHIRMPRNTRIGRIAQEAPDGPMSLLDTVLAADKELSALLAAGEHETDLQRIADIHHRLDAIDAHSAPARAGAILHGLGFDAEQQARPCREFSGGWRMRVALAALLFQAPDLLLLDEPTNHLDLEASLWLEDYLKRYPHTIIIVSHDRDLLNRAVDGIVHLHERKLTLYSGGYDVFERTRAQRLALRAAEAAKQEAQRKHIMEFVDRFRYKASKARQAQSRLKALARMQPIAAAIEERGIEFSFPEPEKLAPPLMILDDVDVGYEPGKPVLTKLALRLDPDDRVALLGANGNGKSTLARLLAGRLKPMKGEVRASAKLKVGYFAQHQGDELDLEANALAIMERAAKSLSPAQARAHLARFGLGQNQAMTVAGELSGGEKARLLLALMCQARPNILILDEPTNHLDIDSRQALVQAINDFPGAVVMVSHDPHLIELTADRLWLVKDGRCLPYDDDLDAYRRLLLKGETELPERKNRSRAPAQRRAGRDQSSQASARPDGPQLKRQEERARIAVEKFGAALKLIEDRFSDPDFYRQPKATINDWKNRHAETKRRLNEAEENWLEIQAALEQIGAEAATPEA